MRLHKTGIAHSYQCLQCFAGPNSGVAAGVWGLLTCTQMLMRAIAQGGCVNTIRESALTADSGRKIPCRAGELRLCRCCAWLFSLTLCQLSCPTSLCVCPFTSCLPVSVCACLLGLGLGVCIALRVFCLDFGFECRSDCAILRNPLSSLIEI